VIPPFSPDPPLDLAEFWREATQEAMEAPLDFQREFAPVPGETGHWVDRLRFRDISGEVRHGWLAYPAEARRRPAFVWIPPYGRESKLPDAYGTRPGLVSLSFNFFGHDAFYQRAYDPAEGYFAQGAESPDTFVFRAMHQTAVMATRVLQVQSEVDESRVAAMGMSQGGGVALWLGAWNRIVRAVAADMPFLGAVSQTLSTRVTRYPLKELVDFAATIPVGMDRVRHTLQYFDTLNVAPFCGVPTQLSQGLRDPACPPETVQSIYEVLPGRKRLVTYEGGHDWHPEMVDRNQEWLEQNLV
jgi:cephalosporin-C deacetylase